MKTYVTPRDYHTFMYLWRWKVATTSAIACKFYPGLDPHGAYKRLLKLEEARFIRCHNMGRRVGFVWMLDKKGFDVIKFDLYELKENGYASESIVHDYYVAALQQGEWLVDPPQGNDIFTEQELRRYFDEHWPAWVPRSSIRRPDGYSLVQRDGASKVYAIEVEFNAKSLDRYRSIASFYDFETKIDTVIWLITIPYIQRQILRFAMARDDQRSKVHNFIYLDAFRKNGWFAEIHEGSHKGKKLLELFWDSSLTSVGTSFKESATRFLLDAKKSPMFPKPSAPVQNP